MAQVPLGVSVDVLWILLVAFIGLLYKLMSATIKREITRIDERLSKLEESTTDTKETLGRIEGKLANGCALFQREQERKG